MFYKCAYLPKSVTFLDSLCYYARRVVEITAETQTTHHCLKEKTMSKALKEARPMVEATVVSVAMVVVALAVPAAILYAAV